MVNFYSPPKAKRITEKLTVTIDDLDAFGQGVAHHQGKTVFVKSALPGEKVDILLTESKKNYAKAKTTKYHNQSPERVNPVCHHYQVCGGCDMQHISSRLQHQAKANALINLLQKEGGLSPSDLSALQTEIIADKPYGYRRRARLAINWVKNGLMIGFRQSESSQIIDIQQCPILTHELESLLIPLQNCLRQLKNKKGLGHVELISVESGVIVLLRHVTPLNDEDKDRLTRFAEQNQVSFYLQGEHCVALTDNNEHYYEIEQLQLTFSPLDFIQVNRNINQKMVAKALDWLALTPTDRVLDLFCGMGNFSLPIAVKSHFVIGIEGVDALVEKAKLNVIRNQGILNNAKIDFFVSNLDDNQPFEMLNQHDLVRVNKVLLDPARSGALNAIAKIVKIQPSHIVYISCNPATLARDSKQLIEAGYRIVQMAILDMFPQTKHVESMLLFMKSGS